MNCVLGLDLGQASDYSAAVLVEKVHVIILPDTGRGSGAGHIDADGAHWREDKRVVDTWHVRAIKRWPLGTDYNLVVDDVSEMMLDPGLLGNAELVLDYGGVGRGVHDMFMEAHRSGRLGPYWPRTVTLTGGFATSTSTGTSTHKGDIISVLLKAAQRGRITIPDMPLADALRRELRAFTLKQDKRTGNVRFEAKRQSDHDDILLAAAMAVWTPIWQVRGEPRYVGADGLIREQS